MELLYQILCCFYMFFVLIPTTWGTEEIELRLQMREETAPFTRIGSVVPSLRSDMGSNLHFITASTFFSVTPTTGEIRVGRLIDRELLCPEHKFCCGVVNCELKASIFVTNKATGEFVASISLKVDIQDQNDNRPTFASSSQTVTVSEAASVGSYINLVPAADADVDPENQIKRYTLIESTNTFKLDVSKLPAVRLQIVKSLDREQVSEYKARLEACDSGACAMQTLDIQISDENDNSPKLANKRYIKTLIENTAVGTVVLQLNATDPDSEERGRILYAILGTVDPDLSETFELVRDTGEIRLKRPLASNIRDSYEFKVVACDAVNRACTGDENSTAEIIFSVQDVNNFPPSIHAVASGAALNSATSGGTQTQEGRTVDSDSASGDTTYGEGLSILENSHPSQIAVLTVRDDDTGENARVTCSLNDSVHGITGANKNIKDFILTPSAPGIYSLRTARVFDYEVESSVRTTVVCHDFGKPQQLTSARVITVRIIDVNEFQPEFSRRVYVGRVAENAPAGIEVLTITAIDRDRAAVLRYRFGHPPVQPGSSDSIIPNSSTEDPSKFGVNQYFVVEPEAGTIRTSHIPLDRETVSSVTLVVLVTDSLMPPIFTATTTVSIEVLDENDNAPVFTNPPAGQSDSIPSGNQKIAFSVMENAPRFTQLSQKLEARDPDQGDNGRVQFSLLATYALTKTTAQAQLLGKSPSLAHNGDDQMASDSLSEVGTTRHAVDQPIFRITSTGAIETLVELDRETVPAYILKVGARDRGVQPLASTAMLRVDVEDANDNAPVWVFPTPVDRTINLTTAMKPGSLAGRLRAEDADTGESGKVEYLFLGPRGDFLQGMSIEEGLLSALASPKQNPEINKKGTNKLTTQTPLPKQDMRGYRVGPLYLNGSTGEIWVAQTLSSGTINLHLLARDQGTPQSHTAAWLTVNVFVDPSDGAGFLNLGGDGTLNVTIILAMITITAIISLFLIIGIVCVRRRPGRYVMPRQANDIDGGMSPGNATTTFSMDTTKDGMMAGLGSGGWVSPVGMYGTNPYGPGQAAVGGTIIDDGQMFNAMHGTGVMGYGAVVTPSETGSMIYVPQAQAPSANVMGSIAGSMTPVPMDLTTVGSEYPNRVQMHTFGTLTRNRVPPNAAIYQGSGGCGITYEPHLDADSGDSGRGPSEEGNQFLLSDTFRNGINIASPTYQYNTYSGYRPSSRMGYFRTDGTNSMNKIHSPACQNTNSNGSCACYMIQDNGMMQQINPYGNQFEAPDGMAYTYHPQHYSPQKSIPLSYEQQMLIQQGRMDYQTPPLPPPRSPQIPGSNSTLRRNYGVGKPLGGDNSQVRIAPIQMNSVNYQFTENDKGILSTNPDGYSDNYELNGLSLNDPINQNGTNLNSTQPPLKLDLRNQHNTTTATDYTSQDTPDETDLIKHRRRLIGAGLGPGLPPLATKSPSATAASQTMNSQNTVSLTSMEQESQNMSK